MNPLLFPALLTAGVAFGWYRNRRANAAGAGTGGGDGGGTAVPAGTGTAAPPKPIKRTGRVGDPLPPIDTTLFPNARWTGGFTPRLGAVYYNQMQLAGARGDAAEYKRLRDILQAHGANLPEQGHN